MGREDLQVGQAPWGACSGAQARRGADATMQIRKCVKVNRCRSFHVFRVFFSLSTLGGPQVMRKGLEVNMKKKKRILFPALPVSSLLMSGGGPGKAGSRHKRNGG